VLQKKICRPSADLGLVMGHSRLTAGGQLPQGWNEELAPRLERPWWPVVRSAAELLTSPHLLDRLGQCADPQCGWLFLDTSKSRTRKWCDINDCGNRAKQRRFQKKKRGREKIVNN
jgi:predicted RNA-binding Zn ribbon-like protein